MTSPEWNSDYCFPRILMFPETKPRETLGFEGNKIHCSPRDQSLSDLLHSKTKPKQSLKKRAEIPATTSGHLWSRATAVNISRVIVSCFPFDVKVFAMLFIRGIWRKTVSLLDIVMWPWTIQWMGALQREKRQLYNKSLLFQVLTEIILKLLGNMSLTTSSRPTRHLFPFRASSSQLKIFLSDRKKCCCTHFAVYFNDWEWMKGYAKSHLTNLSVQLL